MHTSLTTSFIHSVKLYALHEVEILENCNTKYNTKNSCHLPVLFLQDVSIECPETR